MKKLATIAILLLWILASVYVMRISKGFLFVLFLIKFGEKEKSWLEMGKELFNELKK